MYLLIDECCGKGLVAVAERLGHTAQRTIAVGALGPQASDPEIFEFARRTQAVIVTANRLDFLRLAVRSQAHSGVILLPSLPSASLRRLFERALVVGETLFETPNLLVEAKANGEISSFQLPGPPQPRG
jgi:predicted nuclease of predicted toxin-antitoxin system